MTLRCLREWLNSTEASALYTDYHIGKYLEKRNNKHYCSFINYHSSFITFTHNPKLHIMINKIKEYMLTKPYDTTKFKNT